jgi:hypothetical protein
MELDGQAFRAKERDVTLPLLVSGAVACLLCAGLGVAATLAGDSLQAIVAPGFGLTSSTRSSVPTSTPTPPPTPTAVLTSIPLSVHCPEVPADWFRIANETFGNTTAVWPTGSQVDGEVQSELSIGGGALRLALLPQPGSYVYRRPESLQGRPDFYMVTNVTQRQGPEDTDYGVIFRLAGGRHYFFSINGLQQVRLRRHGDDDWRETLFNGKSAAIRPGENNELIVFGQAAQFTLCINRIVVARLENASYPTGRFGIGVLAGAAQGAVVIEYDDIRIYAVYR